MGESASTIPARMSSPPESLLASHLAELGHLFTRWASEWWSRHKDPPHPRLNNRSLRSAWPRSLGPVIIN